MILNPYTEEHHKMVQAQEIERVRHCISKLRGADQALIAQGEQTIDRSIKHQNPQGIGIGHDFQFLGVNVFNLNDDVPGSVMKYLAMLYTAGGYHKVSISCSCYSSADQSYRVRYPNEISFRAKR